MSRQLGIDENLCKVMINRNITARDEIDMYLNTHLKKLFSPNLMKDMERAVDILSEKINKNKKIRIISDYDVDGIISCYILLKSLKNIGGDIDYYIPHRVTDGYGISEKMVRDAANDGIDTIVTCDNGISAFAPVDLAKKLGMTIIITDHHEIPYDIDNNGDKQYKIPGADAIVNPKQLDCTYPFKELCGAGVAFKLIQSIYDNFGKKAEDSYEYMQYLCIATVCDIVDLISENRILVKHGLERLNHTNNKGLKALIEVNDLNNKELSTYSLGFIIGPCLNAAGRLEHGEIALKLLLAEDPLEAASLARHIYDLNIKRKQLTEDGLNETISIIEKDTIKYDKVIIVLNKNLHESVVGIIAGRIKDLYHLPTIVLTQSENTIKGSARSIDNYHLYDELNVCRDILEKFGGHAMAAGLSIEESNIKNLRERMNQQFAISDNDLMPRLYIDAQYDIDNITLDFIEHLGVLEPFGKGNEKPIFGDKNIKIIKARYLGKNNTVLKLELYKNDSQKIEGIMFNCDDDIENYLKKKWGKNEVEKMFLGKSNNILVDIAYYPKINEYMGKRTIQVNIIHIK